MAETVKTYEALAKHTTWHKLPNTTLLRPGDESPLVQLLKENLQAIGDLKPDSSRTGNVYGPEITLAVQRFQDRHGLISDGIVGPNTLRALNVSPQQRLFQLQLNLARFDSVLTRISSPYVLINLPEYAMVVVDSGRTILRSRVIIGKPSLPTYTIYSELNMVVLHPYWYVPTSIAVKEIVPILRRNPGYLGKKGMRLEKSTGTGWVRTNPWRVDWQQVNASNFDYRIVQLEGDVNELGHVKFPFPNRLPQYLHDTPSKELFQYPKRAFSHGCIRVEKPVALANYLLERGSGYSAQKVDKLWQRNKPNHYIRVKEPVPLLIVYLTAWVDDQGQVQFRDDLYGYDVIPQVPLQGEAEALKSLPSGN
ncbi:L,D-transpeptidase family protein [Pontibacter oryzae]|uniref:L,D-transpeptidase family protein n=1 Tax=Pontibacter oryzae TaxID=2304593 RepID=UPI0013153FC9|nr:L,D-transpeptidase family protein [Pontibacter oryzae]